MQLFPLTFPALVPKNIVTFALQIRNGHPDLLITYAEGRDGDVNLAAVI
jgi:hypothetical protein